MNSERRTITPADSSMQNIYTQLVKEGIAKPVCWGCVLVMKLMATPSRKFGRFSASLCFEHWYQGGVWCLYTLLIVGIYTGLS